MRRNIIIGVIAIIIISVLFVAKYIFIDQSVVTFQVTQGVSRVDVFRTSSGQKIASITHSGDIRLLHDGYYYVPVGDGLSSNPVTFSSPSSDTLVVDPGFSDSHLRTIANETLPKVTALLNENYSTVMLNYSIQKFTVYGKGLWAGGLLIRNDSNQNDTKDTYRFVVHNEEGSWSLIGYPDLILTKANNSAAPSDVLLAIDSLSYDLSN